MKISVALAVYNGARFIAQQLESLARQERLPDELIVSDNASTDRTVEIVREFAARAPFPVRLFINNTNLGISKNFERAIGECAGDVIFLCDCDDVWYPQKIATMEQAFYSEATAGIAICDADLVDEQLRPLGVTARETLSYQPSKRALRDMAQGRAKYVKQGVLTQGNCMAFRAKFKQLVLPFPQEGRLLRGWHDYFLAWAIVYSGSAGVLFINKPLVAWRRYLGAASYPVDRSDWIRVKMAGLRTAYKEHPSAMLAPVLRRIEQQNGAREVINSQIREAVLRHWRARCALPKSRFRRLPTVLRELAAGRYHGFANGFRTAVRDML